MDYLKDSKWIYLDKRNYDINDNEIVYFKKLFSAKIGNTLKLIISADSRYELYLNGHFVGRGPCRSGEAEKYYDNYDLEMHKAILRIDFLIRCIYHNHHNKSASPHFIYLSKRYNTSSESSLYYFSRLLRFAF